MATRSAIVASQPCVSTKESMLTNKTTTATITNKMSASQLQRNGSSDVVPEHQDRGRARGRSFASKVNARRKAALNWASGKRIVTTSTGTDTSAEHTTPAITGATQPRKRRLFCGRIGRRSRTTSSKGRSKSNSVTKNDSVADASGFASANTSLMELEDESPETVHMVGWLYLRDQWRWRQRYCVLRGQVIEYFVEQGDREPRGTLILGADFTAEEIKEGRGKLRARVRAATTTSTPASAPTTPATTPTSAQQRKRRYMFRIRVGRKTLITMATRSQSDAVAWVSALQAQRRETITNPNLLVDSTTYFQNDDVDTRSMSKRVLSRSKLVEGGAKAKGSASAKRNDDQVKPADVRVDGKSSSSDNGGIEVSSTISEDESKTNDDDDEDDGATTDTSHVTLDMNHVADAYKSDSDTDNDVSLDNEDECMTHMLSRMTIKMMHKHVRSVARRVPVELIRNTSRGLWERVPSNTEQDEFSMFYSSSPALTADDSSIRACKAECMMNANSDRVFRLLMDLSSARRAWDSKFDQGHVLESLDDHTDVIHLQLKQYLSMFGFGLPVVVGKRDIVMARYWFRCGDMVDDTPNNKNRPTKPAFLNSQQEPSDRTMLRSLERAQRDGCSYVMYFRSIEKRPNNLGKSWGSACARVHWGAIIVEPVASAQPSSSPNVSRREHANITQASSPNLTYPSRSRTKDNDSSDDLDSFYETKALVQDGDHTPPPKYASAPASRVQRQATTSATASTPRCKVTVAWHVDLAGWVHTTAAMHEEQVAELMVKNVDSLRQHVQEKPAADIAGIQSLDPRDIHGVVKFLNAKSAKRLSGGSGLRANSKRLQMLVNTPVIAVGSHVSHSLQRLSFRGASAAGGSGNGHIGGGGVGVTASSSPGRKRRGSLSIAPVVALARSLVPDSEGSRAKAAAAKAAAAAEAADMSALAEQQAAVELNYKYNVPENNVVVPESMSPDGKTSLWWDSGKDPKARKVRGPNYLNGDKVKVESGESALEVVQMQWAFFDNPKAHISADPDELVQQQHVGNPDRPFMFILNFMVPTIGNFVMYMAKRRGVPANVTFDRMLEEFMNGSDEFRNNKFKIIPSIIEGYYLVKRAVGNKPALLCKKIDTSYYKGDNYFEVCIDVGSSRMAKSLMGLVKSYAGSLSLDLAFLMESQTEDELPEIVLGAVRIVRPHMTARKARKAAEAAGK